jgi:hypothetical protein
LVDGKLTVVLAVFFDSRKLFLNGHKVWRVWWQEQQVTFCIFDDLFRCGGLVESSVVEDDDCSWLEFRYKLSFQPQVKRVGVACTIEQKRGCQFFADKAGD